MDISSLIDLNLGHKENTDRLYYDQYRYSLKLRMKDFSCLREIRNTDATLESAFLVVSKRFEQRLNYSRVYNKNSYSDEFSSKRHDLENILEMLKTLWTVRDQIKLVFSGDWGYVYSNDRQLLQSIANQDYVHAYYIKEAVINRPKDTIVLRSSVYQYRSFLKERVWTLDDKTRMRTYLENQSDIKISRGLKYWLKYDTRWPWSRRYHYFDHNDVKIELMLQLICPGIVRTTMPIIEVNS
jgi:hypothetical protein